MTEGFWDKVLLLKGLYDQTLDPVAQRWKLTRMELDLPASGPVLQEGRQAQRSFFRSMCRDFTPEEERALDAIAEKIARNIRDAMKK